jgi:hypothetical protein
MPSQYVWLFLIVVGLILVALIFAWRQGGTLSWLRTQEQMPREERQYYRWRAYRRLFGCLLLITLAVLLAGMYFLGILEGIDQLKAAAEVAHANNEKMTQEQWDYAVFALGYVGWIMAVVFVLMIVVFIDFMAIRRYGMRQRKRIRDDRQAMLARQLPLLKREREGEG